jgi:hypothetical protein
MPNFWRPTSDPSVSRMIGFCSKCATEVEKDDGTCPCCGAETIEANLVTVLKRTSTRRSRRGLDPDGPDELVFPL